MSGVAPSARVEHVRESSGQHIGPITPNRLAVFLCRFITRLSRLPHVGHETVFPTHFMLDMKKFEIQDDALFC